MAGGSAEAVLISLGSTIKTISVVLGVHGISIGVLHHGEVVYNKGFGYRDIEAQIPGNDDTIYYLGFMTKGFTAEAIAILIEEGKLSWSTRVRDVFLRFNQTVRSSTSTQPSQTSSVIGQDLSAQMLFRRSQATTSSFPAIKLCLLSINCEQLRLFVPSISTTIGAMRLPDA
jgi:hypothetical protein